MAEPRTAEPRAADPDHRPVDRLLFVLACLVVGLSIAVLVLHRGPYFAGWDVVAAANGLFLVSTRSPSELLAFVWQHHLSTSHSWIVVSALATLVPGALAAVFPWQHWPHVTTLLGWLLALALLAAALRLHGAHRHVLLLGWAASPALMAFSLAGMAYVWNALPFALALYTVMRCRRSLAWSLALGVVTIELAWQVQELGRTAFSVFVAGALLLPDVDRRCRLAWLATGAVFVALAMLRPSSTTQLFGAMSIPGPSTLLDAAVDLARHYAALRPDHPVVAPLGLLAVPFLGRERWFWGVVVGVQLGLLVFLCANSGPMQGVANVWPRRTLLFAFVCLAAIGALAARGPRLRLGLAAVLLAGGLWQLGGALRWTTRPIVLPASDWGFALPYTWTTLDYMVHPFVVDWAEELRRRVGYGETVLVLYNQSAFDESEANPQGVLERLYLGVGHERFRAQVLAFGDEQMRWNRLPIRAMDELEPTLDALPRPHQLAGFWLHHPGDEGDSQRAVQFRAERDAVRAALEARHRLVWEEPATDPGGRALRRFRLLARDDGAIVGPSQPPP